MLAVLVHLSQNVPHYWLEDSTENNSTSPYLPYLESGIRFGANSCEGGVLLYLSELCFCCLFHFASFCFPSDPLSERKPGKAHEE